MDLKGSNDPTILSSKSDMHEIIILSKKLIEVIKEENKLLQISQINSYQEIVHKKISIVERIEELTIQFKTNPELLLHISLTVKNELQELQQVIEALKEENSLYLRAAIYSNKKISDIIKQILINKVKMNSGYCNKGLYNSGKSKSNKIPSVSYNSTT